ncbi:MAG TPA: GTP cyclohydrolase II RibA [Candidatus Saccharimonadales bacterium]
MITQHTVLPLKHGNFTISYHKTDFGDCVSVHIGDLTKKAPLVRLHSSCLFGEAFHGLDCDCGGQLNAALDLMSKEKAGVVVYHYAEGRGIGLERKIEALELQRTKGYDTVQSLAHMGLQPDLRTYDTVLAALADLNVAKTIRVASQNPHKLDSLTQAGYQVTEIVQLKVPITSLNKPELLTKKHKLGYLIDGID